MIARYIGDRRDAALLILRVLIGVVFLMHGVGKIQGGIPGVGAFLGQVGFPVPVFFGYVLTFVEVLGGIALIIGVFTRLSALLLSIVMILAIITVKASVGLIAAPGSGGTGAELDIALLAGLLAVLLQGPGRYAVEAGREII